MPLAYSSKLILERFLFVVFVLASDVSVNVSAVGMAD